MRIPMKILIGAAAAIALGGCAYGDVGLGLGYGGYGGYGDYGYGYGPYGGYGAYPGYYGGFGAPYYGWYSDYYYPGVGITVYDRYRRSRTWNDRERSYWTSRRQAMTTSSARVATTENWSGFSHPRHRH